LHKIGKVELHAVPLFPGKALKRAEPGNRLRSYCGLSGTGSAAKRRA
jgi:hypothetical protein